MTSTPPRTRAVHLGRRPPALVALLVWVLLPWVLAAAPPQTEAPGGTSPSHPPKGPFGLEAGAGREQVEEVLGALSPLRPSIYMTSNVPEELPGIETLTLVVTQNQGLCRVQATSDAFTSDAAGVDVRKRFEALRARLEERYGEHRVVDTSAGGDDKSFAAQLFDRDRVLLAVWTEGSGSTLAFNLESITLAARGLDTGQAFLSVDYVYTIWSYCQPALEDAEEHP